MKQIRISDVNMKQSAGGFALSFREKIELAKLLDTRYTAFQKSHFKTLFEKVTRDNEFDSLRDTAEFRKIEN